MNHKDRAIELLGVNKEYLNERDSNEYMRMEAREIIGYNQMHSKAIDVVVGLLKKNEGLIRIAGENNIMMMEAAEELQSAKERMMLLEKEPIAMITFRQKCKIIELEKRVEDLLILQKKFGDYHKEKITELQTLKDKLTVEKVSKILWNASIAYDRTSKITCGDCWDYVAQALIKELKATNDK